MYCTNCGAHHDDLAVTCTSCGAQLPRPFPAAGPTPLRIANYLVAAIATTICCCVPFGIVAIVFAVKANTLQGVGDGPGAQEAARKARIWTWVAFLTGIVTTGIVVVLEILGGLLSSSR